MRLSLSVSALAEDCLMLNYPYPLSSAIYTIMQSRIRNSQHFCLTKNMAAVIKISNYSSFLRYRLFLRFESILLRLMTDRLQFAVCFYIPGGCGPLPSKRVYA